MLNLEKHLIKKNIRHLLGLQGLYSFEFLKFMTFHDFYVFSTTKTPFTLATLEISRSTPGHSSYPKYVRKRSSYPRVLPGMTQLEYSEATQLEV